MHLAYLNFVLLAACAMALDLERFQHISIWRATKLLGDATVEIVDKYYVPQAKDVKIFTATDKQENQYRADEAIDYILKKLDGSLPYQLRLISNGTDKNKIKLIMGGFNMFFVDGFESLRLVFSVVRRPVLENHQHFFIVFIGPRIPSVIENEVRRIFMAIWTLRVPNIYIIANVDKKEDVVAQLYTFFPYNERSCNDVNPVVVNEYRKAGFVQKSNVFVDKLRNMHQCPVRILIPKRNAIIKVFQKPDGEQLLQGFEGNIINYIAKAMRFKADIKIFPYDGYFGPNAIKILSNGSADIAVGGLTSITGNQIAYLVTFPHFYDSVGIVKPIGIPYTPLQKLSMPFFSAVWIWLLIAFVAVSIVHYLIFGQSFFDQIDIVMNGSLTQMPRAIRARSLIALWMFATLVLRNAYQGALFDILQAQIRHQPIENIEALMRFNYAIYCPQGLQDWVEDNLLHLKQQMEYIPANMTIQDYYNVVRNESLRGVLVNTKFNTAIYNKRHPEQEPFIMFKEKLFVTSLVMFVKSNSYLFTRLNSQVHNLASTGLLNHWGKQHLEDNTRRARPKKVPEKLTLSQLEGILYICGALYAISIAVFLIEVIVWKVQQ